MGLATLRPSLKKIGFSLAWLTLYTPALFSQGMPTVTAVSIASPSTISAGSRATYAIAVKAGAYPLTQILLQVSHITGGMRQAYNASLQVAPGTTQTVNLDLTTESTWINGTYGIVLIRVIDSIGRATYYRPNGALQTQPDNAEPALGPHTLPFETTTFSLTMGQPTLQMPKLTSLTPTSPSVLRLGDKLELNPIVLEGTDGLFQIQVTVLDPFGNYRDIIFDSKRAAPAAQTVVDASWLNGRYRIQFVAVTDRVLRSTTYERNGTLTFDPAEAGSATLHEINLSAADFEVQGAADQQTSWAIKEVQRLTPAVVYPGGTATIELTLKVGTGSLKGAMVWFENELGLPYASVASNTAPDAAGKVRCVLTLAPNWARGRFQVTSVMIAPPIGSPISYLRSGKIEHYPVSPTTPHTLNLPALDFDFLNRPAPPVITDFPSGVRSYVLGTNPTLTVTATGGSPLTYQWRKDGQPIAGAVSSTLTLTDFRASQAGIYDVQVTNAAATVTSSPAVTVLVANPSIVRQPSSALIPAANAIDLSVEATGASIAFQWYEGVSGDISVPIPDSNRALLRIPPSLQTRSYWVRVTNFAGVAASESVLVPPQTMLVTRQPGTWTTSLGNVALFSFQIKVLGDVGPMSVQVWRDSVNVTPRFVELERTTTRVTENQRTFTQVDFWLQTNALTATDAGAYRFEVLLGGLTQPLLVSQPTSLALTSSGVPRVLTDPASQRVRRGETVTLSVQATGSGPLSYQWRRNRIQISGATQASLTLNGAGELTEGQYDVIVSTATGAVVSSAATVTLNTDHARLTNLSVRGFVFGRSQPLIAGLVIRDPLGRSLPLIIRGVGPTLGIFGISSAMRDPEVVTYASSGLKLAENNDWGGGATLTTAFARVGAFAFLEPTSRDAATMQTPGAGALTVHLNNRVEEGGSGMIEVYDDSDPVGWENEQSSRLVNLSTRVQLVTGQTLIAGFAVGGNRPLRLLVRGAGPALRRFGITQAMDDPRLTVYRADNTVLAANDDWGLGGASAEVAAAARTTGAFAFDPGSQDAALLIDLPPGTATVHLTGSAGEALIELYVVE
ncbi:MAG: immunoglobulin domain-containing protein [Opitutaceae bacterium]